MQRKIGRIVFAIAAAVMLLVTVFYVADRYVKNPFVKKDIIAETETGGDKLEGGEQNVAKKEEESFPISKKWGHALPYEGNLEKIGQPFVIEVEYEDAPILDFHMEFCVNEVRITKERVDTDALYYAQNSFPIQVDEEKNILNNYNYVVVNLTLRNLREVEQEIYVNSFVVYTYDTQTEDLSDMGELQGYKTLADSFEYNKSYAGILIPSGGEYTCNLVYLMTDESLEGKIPYLYYFHTGVVVPFDDQARFVRLDQ